VLQLSALTVLDLSALTVLDLSASLSQALPVAAV
jgi:hypothetical protein